MYFHGGYSEVILFDFWRISTLAGLIGSMIGCFLMGILYEGIKSYREYWMNGAFHTVTYNQVGNQQRKSEGIEQGGDGNGENSDSLSEQVTLSLIISSYFSTSFFL